MKHCKYHPLEAATHYCVNCGTYTCDNCSNEHHLARSGDVSCFICEEPLVWQGATHTAVPFWRRLKEAFDYPFNPHAVGVIAVSAILQGMGFIHFIFYILSLAVITKYCFRCLENTARGSFVPPDVTESFEGNITVLFNALFIFFAAIGVSFLVSSLLGPVVGILSAFIFICLVPASFMVLAIDGELSSALNPQKLFLIVMSIGITYGLLLLLIIVLLSSIQVLSFFMGETFGMTGTITQLVIFNYYMIVMFHLMGYVIFQYQNELGFTADDNSKEVKQRTSDQLQLAKMEVLVKEGEFKEAGDIFNQLLDNKPVDHLLCDRYFKFVCALKDKDALLNFSDFYLATLIERKHEFQVSGVLKRLREVENDYRPLKAKLRLDIANVLYSVGDFKSAAFILKDFHKDFSEKTSIKTAYELMIRCLENMQGMEKTLRQYKSFILKM